MDKIKKVTLAIKSLLFYASTLFFWPLLIVSCGILLIYRKIIDNILQKKLGKKYGGLLNSADNIMITDNGSKYIITSVLIVKSKVKKNIFKIARKRLKEKVFDCPHHFPKLSSTLQVFCGYSYWICGDYKLSDCLTLLSIPDDIRFDEEYLKELTGTLSSKPFPKHNTGLWDVAVIQKPLKNDKKDGFFYYPMVVRFNHAIGDGTSLIALLIHIVGDKNVDNYSNQIFKKLFKESRKECMDRKLSHRLLIYLKKILSVFSLYFYIIFIGLGKLIKIVALRADDHNALHGPALSGEKVVVWHVEDKPKYIPIIKNIKDRVPNTKFSNIIMAAVSASLTNYFKRNSLPIPKYTHTVLTTILQFPCLKPVKLENKTTLLVFELPSNLSDSLNNLLEDVKEKVKVVKYGDVLVYNFLITKAMGLFPMSIRKKLEGPGLQTSAITNVPGGSQVSILDGCVMDNVIPLAPNIKKTGISVSILSYDERLQLGILVDKAILSSQQEVQRIADDIFFYIDLLDVETKNIN